MRKISSAEVRAGGANGLKLVELVHAYSNLLSKGMRLGEKDLVASSRRPADRPDRPRQRQNRLGEAEVAELIVSYGKQVSSRSWRSGTAFIA